MNGNTPLLWPLPGIALTVPQTADHPGSFGAVRKFDIHTGIDLYAPEGQPVVAIEDGDVVSIEPLFTGGDDTPKDADGTPIWLPTSAVLVEGKSGVIAYGEIAPLSSVRVGTSIHQGEHIGVVQSVLKPKKDGTPFKNPANSPSMLHLELYVRGFRKTTLYWKLGEACPPELLNPTSLLLRAQM